MGDDASPGSKIQFIARIPCDGKGTLVGMGVLRLVRRGGLAQDDTEKPRVIDSLAAE
jgi:hypothetical protein